MEISDEEEIIICEDKIQKKSNNQNKKSKKQKKQTRYKKLGLHLSITIGDYTYVYKNRFKSNPDKFTYRCQTKSCGILINITRKNIEKINNPNNKDKIVYERKKNHKCSLSNDNISEVPKNCITEDEQKKKAKKLKEANPL